LNRGTRFCSPIETTGIQGLGGKTAEIEAPADQGVTTEKQSGQSPCQTADNAISRTDWERAEQLYDAFTARVGIPGGTLWPHQAHAIVRVRDAFADGARRIMLQLPTGGGKTRIASTIIRGVCEIGRPVLFVVPAIELVDLT
jgi:primosomal protein N'